MKIAFIALLIISSGAWDQTAQPTALPDGVRFPVTLIDDLVAAHLKVGEEVRFLMSNNLRAPGGTIAIPKDAIVVAHVKELQLQSRGNPAKVYLVFDLATWKGGRMELHAYPNVPPLPPKSTNMTRPDQIAPEEVLYVGLLSHPTAGTILYSDNNFRIPSRSTFSIQQMSAPGPAAEKKLH